MLRYLVGQLAILQILGTGHAITDKTSFELRILALNLNNNNKLLYGQSVHEVLLAGLSSSRYFGC